jgi:hypothetical protein
VSFTLNAVASILYMNKNSKIKKNILCCIAVPDTSFEIYSEHTYRTIEYIKLTKSITSVTLNVSRSALKSPFSSKNSINSLSDDVIIIARAAKNKEKMIDNTVIPTL